MTVFVDDPDFTLHVGDALDVLDGLPAESVHCVVTSPPYWGLRDYGTGSWDGGDEHCDHLVREDPKVESSTLGGGNATTGHQREGFKDVCPRCGARRIDHQLGLEPTPDEYVTNMVAVFREVRRVLRRDGTCWLNIAASYASVARYLGGLRLCYKPKDMVPIPWLLGLALQADGWYLRSDIIWSKPNPMPESVTDRPTKAHEYLFLLTKAPRYYFDSDAIREPHNDKAGGIERFGRIGSNGGYVESERTQLGGVRSNAIAKGSERECNPAGRNKRSVWEIATQPYPDAHFATFPQALVEPCVLAGTSERGCCPVCGAPWERETTKTTEPTQRVHNGNWDASSGYGKSGWLPGVQNVETTGWRPTCDCRDKLNEHLLGVPNVPCTVLDPFMGSGTTALVARRLGRRTIGIELSREYAELAATRLQQLSLLADV